MTNIGRGKRRALAIVLLALCLALTGCADVTMRYTRADDGTYIQTLTVVLNPDEVAAAGQDIDKVFAEVRDGFYDEGYKVATDFAAYTVVAEKTFATTEALNSDLLGSGITAVSESDEAYRSLFYDVDEKHYEFSPLKSLPLRVKLSMYSIMYGGGLPDENTMDITYEYATVYRSVRAYNGETYREGEYVVNAFKVEDDDIILVSYRPRAAVWYAFGVGFGVLLAVAAVVTVTLVRKKRRGNNGTSVTVQ